MTEWYIGTMGFSYKQWMGPFYPAGLNARQHLPYYAERFNSLEIDSTFYGVPAETTVQRWAQVTPVDFRICPKMPRAITHDLRLRDAAEPTAEFLERIRLLGDKLGPILIQFPPDFSMTESAHVVHFISQLPEDLQFATEFRHRSWDRPQTEMLLHSHNISLVAADYIHMPRQIVASADFLYMRFIGPHGRFATKDREVLDRTTDLEFWWAQIEPQLDKFKHVYAYFNNDYAGYSPATANRFKEIVGLEPGEIRPYQQGRLF